MGTRADFYCEDDSGSLEWLGSMAWDGYPGGIDEKLLRAMSKQEYNEAVQNFLDSRDDATKPEQGWPWPWDDSRTTDYAYAFRDGQVVAWCFGRGPFLAAEAQPEELGEGKNTCFPNMAEQKKMTMGKRSGLIVFTA